MAHECPICYMNCHCGGDIDDICLSGTDEELYCTHCDENEDDDGDNDYECPNCGEWNGDHEDNCPVRNPFYDNILNQPK